MATAVVMPKQGNSVESCIIVSWKKQVGDSVAVDDVLCEVETDKATMEVPSPVAGTLLAAFFSEGDDVPVMVNIAAIGQPGEDVAGLAPTGATAGVTAGTPPAQQAAADSAPAVAPPPAHSATTATAACGQPPGLSPRGTGQYVPTKVSPR